MSDKPDPILQQKEQQQLKTQLLWRLGIAGTLIAGVLGAIAWFDQDKKNAAPEVQIPQIAPVASIASAITHIEPASAVASEPEAAPTISAAPSPAVATIAPNQTQSEPISNIPKRTTETSQTKKPATVPAPTALPEPTLTLAPTTPPSLPAANFPAASSSHLGFSVQAGVFLHASNAEKLLAQIQTAGIPAYLETRVQIGPFKTRAEADAAVKKLRKLGIEPIIKTQ